MNFNTTRLQGMIVFLLCVILVMLPPEGGIVSVWIEVLATLVGIVSFAALCFGDFDFNSGEPEKPKDYEIWTPDFTSETILKWNDNEADVILARDEFGALYLGFQFKKSESRQFWLYTKLNDGQQELLKLHKLPFGDTFRNASAGYVWMDETNYDNSTSLYSSKILTSSLTSEMLPLDELL